MYKVENNELVKYEIEKVKQEMKILDYKEDLYKALYTI